MAPSLANSQKFTNNLCTIDKVVRLLPVNIGDLLARDPSIRPLQVTPGSVERPLTSVEMINDFDTVSGVAPGTLVVLGPGLSADAASYRFDLALGRLPEGVAGVALSGTAGEPSPTALRTMERKDIALVGLDPAADVAALAVHVRDVTAGGHREAVTRLEMVTRIVDDHNARTDGLERLLGRLSAACGCEVAIRTEANGDYAVRLDPGSGQPVFLTLDTPVPGAVLRTAAGYAGRAIEEMLRRDFEEANFPVQSRGDLLNEFLLSDANTGADALARLRRSGFPVDGHHLAARVDLHNVGAAGRDVAARYRLQQQAARLLSDAVSAGEDAWTTAGTNTSVLLVRSEPRRNPRHAEVLETRLSEGLDRLERLHTTVSWAAGIGTTHVGAGGLRNTVDEATSALRAAQSGGEPGTVAHFDRLGFARALIRWYEIDDVRATIDEILAPLTRLGERKVPGAIHTLQTYLDSGQNIGETAARLHVHRNTVRYRIDRILEVLEVDFNDPEQRLLVELGTRAMRIS